MTAENRYRQLAYETANSVGMVIVLFEYAVDALSNVLAALESGDIERRTNEVGRAITAIGELQAGLDFERGGDVARRMERFYSLMRGQMLEGQIKASKQHFQRVRGLLITIRDAWKEAELQMRNAPQAPSAASTTPETTPPVAPGGILNTGTRMDADYAAAGRWSA